MPATLTEEIINSVYDQIKASPKPIPACDLNGDPEVVLLAIRDLRRRGLITGHFQDDDTRAGDDHGKFLDAAARLTASY